MTDFQSFAGSSQKLQFRLVLFSATVVLLLFATSCSVIKPPGFFLKNVTKDTTVSNLVATEAEVKIQNTDILDISVSSLNPVDDAVFNAPGDIKGTSSGYQISSDGNIFLHKLGKVFVTGLTRKELKIKLENGLQSYFKDPIVTVNFENHRVTILGAMGTSKVLNIPTEKISIFEALGTAGGNLENAKLNNVVVVRESDGNKEIKHVNLEDHSIFSSPWYYLQPNDVVILIPDSEKSTQEQKRLQTQTIATLALQGVSLAVIIYSNFIRR